MLGDFRTFLERSEVPGGCDKCEELERIRGHVKPENYEVECAEICNPCVWGKSVSPLVPYLYRFLELQDGGCPIGRHELLDEHWRHLGYMRNLRESWNIERAKSAAERAAAEKAARGNKG